MTTSASGSASSSVCVSPGRDESDFHMFADSLKYRQKRYEVSSWEELDARLDMYGVAVIPGVLNADEIAAMNSGMWDAVEEMSADFCGVRETKAATAIVPIRRDDRSTWEHMREFMPLHRFLLQHHSIGHAKYAWDVRAHRTVRKIFSKIHGVSRDALVTSFDGVGIYLPPASVSTGHGGGGAGGAGGGPRESLWLHTDQRFCYDSAPFERCVQSWVTGQDVCDGGATLAFLEGSHRHHAEFGRVSGLEKEKKHKEDWFRLEKAWEYDFFLREKKCIPSAIKCPAGSMVLWDSRVFHCGIVGVAGRDKMRNVVYVCMAPRAGVSGKAIEKRRDAFRKKRLTTHTPGKCKLFPVKPRTYGRANVQVVRAPPMYGEGEMSAEMRALVPL